MRRILIFLLCVAALITPVLAASGVSSAESITTVDKDGTCDVSLTLNLRLEETAQNLTFPLPGQARDITLNGQRLTSTRKDSKGNRLADLSQTVSAPGSYTLVLRYSLPDAVAVSDSKVLTLTVPLLNGFRYPIETMHFSVTLPGQPENNPQFFSTYYQDNIALYMSCAIRGKTVSGTFNQALRDHESVVMTLAVSDKMFPQNVAKRWSVDELDLVILGAGLLVIVYWLVSMRCLPPQRIRCSAAPSGISPGDVGCHLTGQGLDFTMLVIAWAQMGYLLIHLDDDGRVLLHRRMTMGNERSDFESQCFRRLFGKRKLVDTGSPYYTDIAAMASGKRPGLRLNYRPGSGNPWVFRALAAAVGILGGLSLADTLASDTATQTALRILLSVLGAVMSWQMQGAMQYLHTRRKNRLWRGLLWGTIWMIAGCLTEEWLVAFFAVPLQFLAGLGAAYGGRRTELGRQTMEEILGLRRYLRSVGTQELNRIHRHNGDYFYEMAPWAMALGMERSFARQLGNRRLRQCTYLTTGMDGHLTAREWIQLLRAVVAVLDNGTKKHTIRKLLSK